ncbi:MAG: YqaJ viral recombinase family protein [Myxococcota bacterium]|nr:YqaJ viral recombinase family protein [Myxococcota bacterium]
MTFDRWTHYPDRDSWAADRRSGAPDWCLGATDAAAIQGVGWRTPWGLWSDARGESPSQADSPILRRGRRWEAPVLDAYHEATKYSVQGLVARVAHPEHAWLRASPDAVAEDDETRRGLVEIKTAGSSDGWGEDGTLVRQWDEGAERLIPAGYAVQVYVQLACSGLPWCDVVVAIPDRVELVAIRVLRIEADLETQGALVASVAAWRERHLLGGEPPPLDGTSDCTRAIARRFRGDGTKQVRPATAAERALVESYASCKARLRALEDEGDKLRNRILESIGDSYGLEVPGLGPKPGKALAVRSAGRESVSLARLREQAPDVLETLRRRALVSHGEPSTSLRLYGLGSD